MNNAAVAPGRGNRHAVTEVDYATWQRAWRETVEVDLFAAAVVHLSSPGAVWASGAVLDLNGASHLR